MVKRGISALAIIVHKLNDGKQRVPRHQHVAGLDFTLPPPVRHAWREVPCCNPVLAGEMFVLAEFTPVRKDLVVVLLGTKESSPRTCKHFYKESRTRRKQRQGGRDAGARQEEMGDGRRNAQRSKQLYTVSHTVIPIKLGQHITQRLVKNVA